MSKTEIFQTDIIPFTAFTTVVNPPEINRIIYRKMLPMKKNVYQNAS